MQLPVSNNDVRRLPRGREATIASKSVKVVKFMCCVTAAVEVSVESGFGPTVHYAFSITQASY